MIKKYNEYFENKNNEKIVIIIHGCWPCRPKQK